MVLQLMLTAFMAIQTGYLAYTSPEQDYSFEINENASYKRDLSPDGYSDNFDVAKDTSMTEVLYTMVLTKVKVGEKLTLEDIAGPTFKNSFQTSCNCTVNDVKQVTYKNTTGILFTFHIKQEGVAISGYTYNVPKGETMYSLSYVAIDDNFKKYKPEYDHTVNSMIVK